MYSALKYRGQPLYRLARKGIDVDRKPREITVHSISMRHYNWPEFTFVTCCSKGTYVRSLVGDVAAQLGTLAHVTALRRLEIGPFAGLRMHTLEALEEAAHGGRDALDSLLLPIDRALPDWPSLKLSHDLEDGLRHGGPFLRVRRGRLAACGCMGRRPGSSASAKCVRTANSSRVAYFRCDICLQMLGRRAPCR